jgi:hypothetical protein
MNENKIEKQTFTYPVFFRILFRYGNIFITLLLVVYSVPLIVNLDKKMILIIPLLINLFIIYFLNRHYLNNYKILPFKIEANDEKLVCTYFFFSKKEVVIYYSEIKALSGGSFENKLSGIMKVYSGNNPDCIGFYHRLKNSSKLVTYILSKVNRPLYDEVLKRITIRRKKY